MDSSAVTTFVLNAIVSLTVALGGLGIIQYRANRRNINSQADVNEANAQLVEGQLTIQLSQEARQLIEIYRSNAADARKEAHDAKVIAIIDRKRTDFLIAYLRTQGIPVPEFPEELR